jgi:ABC-2 type transport system ATP-binding protein
MDEAQYLADRVAVIAEGCFVAVGSPESIGGRSQAAAQIRFALPEGAAAADLPVPATLHNGGVLIECEEPTKALHMLTSWALDRNVELSGLSVTRPTLEDVYLELTGDE